jgi:uncharacterized lipoprotein YddW (UPF0748 family)
MTLRFRRRALPCAGLALAIALLAAAATARPRPEPRFVRVDAAGAVPEPAREFRGAWVAAVSNIDWPSRRGLPVAQQQAELTAILDHAARLGLNALILQVRPAGDALYISGIEPWSEYLTGTQGVAPVPLWDPLAFAVTEAHRRGLELHAWFNPFRARHPSARSPEARSHISVRRPDLVVRYGTHLWMDPAHEEVRQHAIDVILDVVRRYDVDGVHVDDYFYPYQERDARSRIIPFPDDGTWQRYRANGGTLARDDWRRANIDGFVEAMYRAVKAEKPWVRVGISPFGIWRPGHPEGVWGLDSWRDLYKDSKKWLNNGWLDYVAPQLYWLADAPQQRYPDLLQWWTEQNLHHRHVWPGNYSSRVGVMPNWTAEELIRQIRITRAQAGATGNIHFSMTALLRDQGGLAAAIARNAYDQPALVPASPWLDATTPPPPAIVIQTLRDLRLSRITLHYDGPPPARWIVRQRLDGRWSHAVHPAGADRIDQHWPDGRQPDAIAVAALSRTGVLGEAVLYELR